MSAHCHALTNRLTSGKQNIVVSPCYLAIKTLTQHDIYFIVLSKNVCVIMMYKLYRLLRLIDAQVKCGK